MFYSIHCSICQDFGGLVIVFFSDGRMVYLFICLFVCLFVWLVLLLVATNLVRISREQGKGIGMGFTVFFVFFQFSIDCSVFLKDFTRIFFVHSCFINIPFFILVFIFDKFDRFEVLRTFLLLFWHFSILFYPFYTG